LVNPLSVKSVNTLPELIQPILSHPRVGVEPQLHIEFVCLVGLLHEDGSEPAADAILGLQRPECINRVEEALKGGRELILLTLFRGLIGWSLSRACRVVCEPAFKSV
jgi:hypothetical protein